MELPPTGRKARFGMDKIKSKIPFRPSSAARPTAAAVVSSDKNLAAQCSEVADTIKADKKFSPICELWNEAYNEFRQKEEILVKDYETILSMQSSIRLSDTKLQRKEQMNKLLQTKMEEVNQNTWRLKFGTKDVLIKDLVQPVVNIISSANGFIQDALAANPYASLAWAGVSVILPVFLNPSKQAASLTSSLEYISGLIVQSAMREELYKRRYELNIDPEDHTDRIFDSDQCSRGTFANSHAGYRDTLKELYVKILRFQATGVCYFSRKGLLRIGSDIVKWDGWDSLLTDIKTQEASFTNINDVWRDAKYEEDCASIEKRHQESLKNLISVGSDVSALRRAVDDAQCERDRSGLLEWLSAVNPSQNYNLARDRHEPNTGEWLIRDNDVFKAWEGLPHSFLWLHGKAGSGKSILSSSIIKHLQDNHKNDPNTALAYFYFSFSDATKQDVAEMLCCLIKQICCRRPDIPKLFEDLRNFKDKGHQPDTETLEKTLGAVISGFSDVYVVIDALDECPVSNGERERLLDKLDHILSRETSQNLHLLCTSRNEYDIAAVLLPFCSGPRRAYIDLSTNSAAIETDIGLYIDNKLNAPWYRFWSPQIKTLAKETLIQKSNCM